MAIYSVFDLTGMHLIFLRSLVINEGAGKGRMSDGNLSLYADLCSIDLCEDYVDTDETFATATWPVQEVVGRLLLSGAPVSDDDVHLACKILLNCVPGVHTVTGYVRKGSKPSYHKLNADSRGAFPSPFVKVWGDNMRSDHRRLCSPMHNDLMLISVSLSAFESGWEAHKDDEFIKAIRTDNEDLYTRLYRRGSVEVAAEMLRGALMTQANDGDAIDKISEASRFLCGALMEKRDSDDVSNLRSHLSDVYTLLLSGMAAYVNDSLNDPDTSNRIERIADQLDKVF